MFAWDLLTPIRFMKRGFANSTRCMKLRGALGEKLKGIMDLTIANLTVANQITTLVSLGVLVLNCILNAGFIFQFRMQSR